MGYAAARGGLEAIEAAEELVRRHRLGGESPWLGLDQIIERQRLAVDRVMGEGGLWDARLAAMALRQAEGDSIEAAHLLRAYRSTLPRLAYSEPIEADELRVLRRIVPAYQKPPGPQLLGRTTDYAGRLIELRPDAELQAEGARLAASVHSNGHRGGPDDAGRVGATEVTGATGMADVVDGANDHQEAPRQPARLYDLLRQLDLVVDRRPGSSNGNGYRSGGQDEEAHRSPPATDRLPRDGDGSSGQDEEPFDLTRRPAQPPAPRSARLAAMARAETGALVNLWYRNILGPDGYLHEVTLGEVRHGYLPVPVRHPLTGGTVRIGRVRVTEVEAIEDLDGPDEPRDRFDVGYGMVLGHNERKAIAMANLDIACHRDNQRASRDRDDERGSRDGGRTGLEQSLLLTTDGLDASGFLEHLKLPHYVTFRSMVERKLAVRRARDASTPEPSGRTSGPEGDCA